jgi:DNA-binding TFAR19-related protein (PDSD5 family)
MSGVSLTFESALSGRYYDDGSDVPLAEALRLMRLVLEGRAMRLRLTPVELVRATANEEWLEAEVSFAPHVAGDAPASEILRDLLTPEAWSRLSDGGG